MITALRLTLVACTCFHSPLFFSNKVKLHMKVKSTNHVPRAPAFQSIPRHRSADGLAWWPRWCFQLSDPGGSDSILFGISVRTWVASRQFGTGDSHFHQVLRVLPRRLLNNCYVSCSHVLRLLLKSLPPRKAVSCIHWLLNHCQHCQQCQHCHFPPRQC